MAFRTKKISQMDPKGSNLASTDLLEISELVSGSYVTKSITGAEIIASIPPSTTAWGTITGTLSAQTDLNTALSGKVPTTRTLTINGTTQDLSADRTFTISTGITIGTTAITSGTVGRVLFEGTGNVVQESANLFWDNTNNRLGIGTATPTASVDIRTTTAQPILINTSSNIEVAQFFGTGTSGSPAVNYAGFRIIANTNGVPYLGLNTSANAASNVIGTQRAYIAYWGDDFGFSSVGYLNDTHSIAWSTTTGNVKIGGVSNGRSTFTDAGYKLDVNGTLRVQGNVTGTGDITCGSGFAYNFGSTATQIKHYNANSIAFLVGNAWYGRITTGGTVFGSDTITASAALEAVSTTKGFLPPRMTTTQKNAIASPAAGLMVFDSTLGTMSVYNGTIWISL